MEKSNGIFGSYITALIIDIFLIIFFIFDLIWINKIRNYSQIKELSPDKIKSCLNPINQKRKLINNLNEDNIICDIYNEINPQKNLTEEIIEECFIKNKKRLIRFLSLKKEMIKEECDNYINIFIEKGAIETFNIKMSEFYKYSNALFIVIFSSIIVFVLSIIFIIMSILLGVWIKEKSRKCIACSYLFILFIESCGNLILFVLHLIYFILLFNTHSQGKFIEIISFKNCSNINKNIFENLYSFLFKIEQYYNQIFVITMILFIIGIVRFCINLYFGINSEKSNNKEKYNNLE